MKTSDLFKRAKQLADLEGSDFISWNEAENCINEAYIGLYEKLINMGDNSFVESFRTSKMEIDLPSDFWQLKGVYLWNNGSLQVINRRADNNGIHHTSYEMRNGKIIRFGNPNECLIEYYRKPKYLTMPPSDIEASLNIPTDAEVLDCCGHTFLYASESALNIFDLDGIKTASAIAPYRTTGARITNDFVYESTGSKVYVYDLTTGFSAEINNVSPLVTESGNFYVMQDGVVFEVVIDENTYELIPVKTIETDITEGLYNVSNDDFSDFYSIVDGEIYHNDVNLSENAERIIYADKKCYFLAKNKAAYIENDEIKNIKMGIGSAIGFIGINKDTGYGYCTKKYNRFFVCAYCEDTELDFPNSFYYQMLSYLLAIAFRSKQGADITLLSAQLEMVSQTFEDTLGSDAFQFPRMGNVYN
jgi:hypothetical protein